MKRAIFMDRDGVINVNAKEHEYIKFIDEFKFITGALESFKLFSKSNFLPIVVTNQNGIHRKILSKEKLSEIHNHMISQIIKYGGVKPIIYWCGHGDEDDCDCRKPKPGMLLRAAKDLDVDLSQSWMIDDAKSGIEAGAVAGCQTILVKTGLGLKQAEQIGTWKAKPDNILENLLEAVQFIYSHKTSVS